MNVPRLNSLIISIIIITFLNTVVNAQVETQIISENQTIEEVIPWYFEDHPNPITLPKPNVDSILKQDSINKNIISRYGIPVSTSYSEASGTFYEYAGYVFWKLKIHSRDATLLSFLFSNLNLEDNSLMYIYGKGNKMIIGPINSSQVYNGHFVSDLVYGDSATIFVIMEEDNASDFTIRIDEVVYGILTSGNLFEESLPCHENVECFNNWEDEIDAVCYIYTRGEELCTGSLINDVCQSFRPFILTAWHCIKKEESTELPHYTFRFNYESPTCDPNIEPTSWITISGADILSGWSDTDFALLELRHSILGREKLSLAGWDRSTNTPNGETRLIHHPEGDVKKITVDAGQSNIGTNPFIGKLSYIEPNHYFEFELSPGQNGDIGSAEIGTSGAPHYNLDHRIVAQQFGVNPNFGCDNAFDVYSGVFFESWNGDGSIDSSLVQHIGGPGNPLTTNSLRVFYIDDPGILCSGNPAFNLLNPPPNSTGIWSVSLQGQLFDIGNGFSIDLNNFPRDYSGNIDILWDITDFGCEPLSYRESFWFGPPKFDLIVDHCDGNGIATILPKGGAYKDNLSATTSWNFYGSLSGSGGPVVAKFKSISNPTGNEEVCATVTNVCGSTTKCVPVKIDPNTPCFGKTNYILEEDSISDLISNIKIRAYPNPTNENINIQLSKNEEEELFIKNIKVFDYFGRIIQIENELNIKNNITLNLNNFTAGVYYIKVELSNNYIYTKRIIVLK